MTSTDPDSNKPDEKDLEKTNSRPYPELNEDGALSDDERIDEAIAESFPASDPPSYGSGVDRD